MATNHFLHSCKNLAEGKFYGGPVLKENVLTFDVSDDQFVVIAAVYIPEEVGQHIHYLLTNVQFDGHGFETCRKVIYGQDDATYQDIRKYIVALYKARWATMRSYSSMTE